MNYSMQIDCMDLADSIYLGLSNLEGNVFDGAISKVSLQTGEQLSMKHCHCGIAAIKVLTSSSMDQNKVIIGRDDGNIGLYDGADLSELNTIDAHDDIVSAILPMSSNSFISASWDGCINIWDMEQLSSPQMSGYNAHSSMVNDMCWVDNISRNELASVGQDGFLRLWDCREDFNQGCQQIYNIGVPGACVAGYESNDNICFVGTDGGTINVYDLRNSSETLGILSTHTQRVRRVVVPAGRSNVILSCSDDITIAISNLTDLLLGSSTTADVTERLQVHSDYVSDISFLSSEDGCNDMIFSVSTDKSLKQSVVNLSKFI